MDTWRKIRLGDVCKTNINSYSPKENWAFVNYLDTGNITDNRIDSIQYIDVKHEKLPSRARRKVRRDSIIFSTVRPNQRHFGIIKTQPEHFLVSTGFTVIDSDAQVLDADFLYYLLTQATFVEKLHAIAEQSTSAYPSIKASDIEDLEIEIPNLSTQKKIANLLGCLDIKMKLNADINKNLLDQMGSLYRAWFVDLIPFNGIRPANWQVTDIYSIANIIYGAPFKSKLFNTEGNGIPIIRIRDLKEQIFVTYTTERPPKGHLIHPGDIVVGMDGEFRPYIWGNTKAWLNQRVCIFNNKM